MQSPIFSLASLENPFYFSSFIPGIRSLLSPQSENLTLIPDSHSYGLPRTSLMGLLDTCSPLEDKYNHSFKLEETLDIIWRKRPGELKGLPWHHPAVSVPKPEWELSLDATSTTSLCLAQEQQKQLTSRREISKFSCINDWSLDHSTRSLLNPPGTFISLAEIILMLPCLHLSLSI